ncbi:hypothetical protein AKJ09_00167 [Labilithrix luteola]|uniref:Uncharacterized protein n=1 Tax=Labilithrix luteola TaxID=1391654 RepID=A0A0K1PIY3_9BACT|nr:hypothetical protein AKJ09_00167 [Labilithrix luteola]
MVNLPPRRWGRVALRDSEQARGAKVRVPSHGSVGFRQR